MPELTTLLQQPAGEGFPTEYLLARIRSRRASLLAAGRAAMAGERADTGGPPVARKHLQAEFGWAYRQMNGKLRKNFAPFFFWFEVRTLLLCLRFRRGGERGKATGLLAGSLLAVPLQRILAQQRDGPELIDELAGQLATVVEPCRGLGAICRQQEWIGCEQVLVACCLEHLALTTRQSALQEFFRAYIDLRNLVLLAKMQRWQRRVTAPFLRGGEIAPVRLEKAREEGSPASLAALVAALPNAGAPPAAAVNLEPFLLGWLTRKVRALGRDPLGDGLILDYLWNSVIEARRVGLLVHGSTLEHETLSAELPG